MTTVASAEPCPGESCFEDPVFGPVENLEFLVRFVGDPINDVVVGGNGEWRLAPTSFSSSDINGKKDATGRKAVSTFRWDIIDHMDLVLRAVEKTKQCRPLVALASTEALRQVVDKTFRRDLCVFADCSEPIGHLPASPCHASIRKSDPEFVRSQRTEMLVLRSALADVFVHGLHLLSNVSGSEA